MSSREEILSRLRNRLGGARPRAGGQEAIAQALAQPEAGPRPRLPGERAALTERFIDKSIAQSSTVERIVSWSEAPVTVARFLSAQKLPPCAVIWPRLIDLDWASAGVSVFARGAEGSDAVGVTGCFCAIAETGTLMLCSSPETPATVSLLPETHIALVPVSRIVATMEDAFALARRELGRLPRAVNFVSGPSRTGDIEQTIVLGAHGPSRVHLILLEEV